MPTTITANIEKEVWDFVLAFKTFAGLSDEGRFLVHRGSPSDYYSYDNESKFKSIFYVADDRNMTIWFFADPECNCRVRLDFENKPFKRIREWLGFRGYERPEITIQMQGYEIFTTTECIRKILKYREKYMLDIMAEENKKEDEKKSEAELAFKSLADNDFRNPVEKEGEGIANDA